MPGGPRRFTGRSTAEREREGHRGGRAAEQESLAGHAGRRRGPGAGRLDAARRRAHAAAAAGRRAADGGLRAGLGGAAAGRLRPDPDQDPRGPAGRPRHRAGPGRRRAPGTPPEADRNLAGWYRGAVTPGQRGTAILAYHVDTRSGPAVFYSLGALHQGDRIEIARADGSTAVFQIYAIEVYDKQEFPDDRVYGQAGDAQLRLITCGGGFSERDGYRGNVVAYAFLVDTARGARA